jgi:hypothetical protein
MTFFISCFFTYFIFFIKTRYVPAYHRMRVTPSGRFPSERNRPLGSFEAGISADAKARNVMSFDLKCRVILPHASLQDKPMVTTSKPQEHLWWMLRSTPRRVQQPLLGPTASLSSPHEALGSKRSAAVWRSNLHHRLRCQIRWLWLTASTDDSTHLAGMKVANLKQR